MSDNVDPVVVRYINPPGLNNWTASKYPYPPYRCAVCGRFRNNYDGHCKMDIGLWLPERRLGRVCPTCQDQLHHADAVTVGSLTQCVFVRPDYRLRLRKLHAHNAGLGAAGEKGSGITL